MHPTQYLQVKIALQSAIDALKIKIFEAYQQTCDTPPPKNLRPATAADIVLGNIIWYPNSSDNGESKWRVVEEVRFPGDKWKAFVSDGARYGLDNAFVEVMGNE